ncbi:MAG: nuclease PIN [Caulobacterales bacterium 68-7]|nr:MAG: nuclease PIN [Caulobacterales bacterium 68-7]
MLSWFQALLPKEDQFFRLFADHAATLPKGAKALRAMLDGGPDTANWCARVVEHENEADAVAREVLLAVRRSFITPFDRSDIRELTNALDDAIDQMQKTSKVVTLYDLQAFAPHMQQLGDIAVTCADLAVEAIALLPQIGRNQGRLNELTEQMVRLEGESDALYDAGMRALFEAHRNGDALAFLIGAELYDHLEKVVDRFEDVANTISGILVEHL